MAAGIITTGSTPKALWPGIIKWWGIYYDKHPMQYDKLFDVKSSDKAYEEMPEIISFGLAPEKEQGTSVQYASQRQGSVNRFTNKAYALGYIVTHEEEQDNLYEEVSRSRTEALAFSMRTTKEIVGANVYNRGFNGSFLFGDGQPLLSTAHPTDVGNQSNRLTVDADFSEAALEDMLIQIADAKNSTGLDIALKAQTLHIPTALVFEAERVLASILQNDTANNAVNAIRSLGLIPGGHHVNNYFTDSDAWFLRTDAPVGMCWFQREEISFTEDNDFDTSNYKYKAYERYVPGVGDWRGVYGSPGA